MTKLLFGQSYYLRFDAKLWEAMQPYPPLGTLYAASYMRQRDYQVALFDAMLAESETAWANALDQEQPDFAIIYEDNFNYLSKMCLLRMRQAAFTMTQMARQRSIPVIIAGSDASDHAAAYLEEGADYVLIGEGEETLGELLDTLTGRSTVRLDQIPGLAWKDEADRPAEQKGTAGDARIADVAFKTGQGGAQRQGSPGPVLSAATGHHQTPRRPDIRGLDALPFPAWDLVDMDSYRKIWLERQGYYSMNMVTTRGCPYHCNWCAKPIWGQRYNVRSPENVVAEMKWVKENYGPDHIWFADDIMGLKPGWLARFADLVEEQDAKIPFKCLSRADLLLREGDVDALQRAGAQIVWIGAESGSQKILTAMEKGTRVQQIYECRRLLAEAGIKVGFFLQFGYPGETRQDIDRTLQMVRDLMPDDIGMSVSYPLPGTKFYERVRDQLGSKQNWYDSEDLAMMYQGPFATDFYRQLHKTLHKEYRARKYWSQLRKLVRRPAQMRGEHLRQTAALLYHTLSLPLARRRLRSLESLPHEGAVSLPGGGMTIEESSIPTLQD